MPSSAFNNSNLVPLDLPKLVNSVSVDVFLYSTSNSLVVPKVDVTLIIRTVDTTPEYAFK